MVKVNTIQGMTAFASAQLQEDWGTATCELRSLNHRYLEVNLRLPEILRDVEMTLRDFLRQNIQRGKIEGFVYFQATNKIEPQININEGLVSALMRSSTEVAAIAHLPAQMSVLDILRWPGVLELTTSSSEHNKSAMMTLFQNTVQELIAVRQREGQSLVQFLKMRLVAMQEELAKVVNFQKANPLLYKEKLLQKISDLTISCDLVRLEQEVVVLAQKSDIAEELDRLHMHLQDVEQTLTNGGAVGRRLDFLMQELNREVNTIASKAIDDRISKAAIEMKILIEQMREQIQNIE